MPHLNDLDLSRASRPIKCHQRVYSSLSVTDAFTRSNPKWNGAMGSLRAASGKGFHGIITTNCKCRSFSRPPQRLRFSDRRAAEMADEVEKRKQISSKGKDEIDAEKEKKEEEREESPPEKPLPGDCCGSGCVRCVWDVYYEELEDYNRRQEQKNKR